MCDVKKITILFVKRDCDIDMFDVQWPTLQWPIMHQHLK
jgi:hypothetical protein